MERREQFFRYIMFPFYDQSCLGLNSCELEDLCSPEANYPTFTRNLCIEEIIAAQIILLSRAARWRWLLERRTVPSTCCTPVLSPVTARFLAVSAAYKIVSLALWPQILVTVPAKDFNLISPPSSLSSCKTNRRGTQARQITFLAIKVFTARPLGWRWGSSSYHSIDINIIIITVLLFCRWW